MTPEAIYVDFIRYENRTADLYLNLSIHFYEQIDLSWFWVEMAMAEKQRAGLLQYCIENRVFARDLPDPAALRHARERLEELEPRTADPALSLDGAFDLALQVETREVNEIRSRLITPIDGPVHVLRKKESVSPASCLVKLRSAAERFSISPDLRSRFAALG